jgi:DNA gyrase/topoisomerase IV subunit A
MRLLGSDEVVAISILTGNSDLLVLTSNGNGTYFNENELTILGNKAGGVKSISGLGKNTAAVLLAFDEDEKSKFVVVTDKGHERVLDNNRFVRTQRLGKVQPMLPVFKSDIHHVVSGIKVPSKTDVLKLYVQLNDQSFESIEINDLYLTDMSKYAKKNMEIPSKTTILFASSLDLEIINKDTVSHPVAVKEKPNEVAEEATTSTKVEENVKTETASTKVEEAGTFKQISIFDDLED